MIFNHHLLKVLPLTMLAVFCVYLSVKPNQQFQQQTSPGTIKTYKNGLVAEESVLSDDANYPSPVLQLQQLMTQELIKEQTVNEEPEIFDEKLKELLEIEQSSSNEKAPELQALTEKINQLESLLAN